MGKHMDVKRTLNAGDRGTQKYLHQYGEQLLNVRYREDKSRNMRYTTVELIVDAKPIQKFDAKRLSSARLISGFVSVKIEEQESQLIELILHHGAKKTEQATVWRISLLNALQLGLSERILNYADRDAAIAQ
jgi:hypothetical protein